MSSNDGPGPELSRNLIYLLKHAHLRMAELTTKALTPYGIDGRELGVLLALTGREPTSQQQAAQRLGIDRTTMVAMLDALEAKGLVSRHPDAEDRRRNVVELTDAGKDTLRQAVKATDDAEREFLARLTPQAAEQLRNSLQTIVIRPNG
ncbi:DNA-binding MarR family transcriptional regulator [Thermocatellispora tengchongensis]|uniref:DNA-binding MarR family transcriptional regulator n=1 Tax=Thermocatellispora tengchongensis TaxID=1073253 RepID=A0A840P929_9ACTN|nr:MarR family transcriptional regulator [Thermocatellispora tengchongensis]MBB5137884.1 DNA-binding MarR family transcriptional regulator [Thermocatellispora tengchongensis]